MFGKKIKTKTVSSVVSEDVEKWIKARAKAEGVSPSLWIADVLVYSMMTDAMTGGELSNVVHDLLRLRDLAHANRQFDMNPWQRHLSASKDYAVSRVRRGLLLYRRGNNVPDSINNGLVTVLANTSDGRDFRSVYNPLSDAEVMEALRVMERNGEVAIEGDSVRVIELSNNPLELKGKR